MSQVLDLLSSRLDIELTERCNNACRHCYINLAENDDRVNERELSTAQWQDILRQAANLGVMSVRFTGGEPLLRQDFVDLYMFARRQGMKVLLFTNGRLITPELADLFARVPLLEKIEITVYGMHPESYDAEACAPGAYAQFRRGVELLLERRVPFIVKSALLPSNREEMAEFEAWAATIPWMDEPPTYSMFFDLRCRRDSPKRNRLIQRLRISPTDGLAVIARNEGSYRKEMKDFCSRFIGPAGEVLFTCGAGKSVCIDAYGKIQPCLLLRDPSLVYDTRCCRLGEALESFSGRLRQIKASDSSYIERCSRCFLHGLCEQCPAKSWSEHGTLDTPVEYLCQIAHAQANYLGLLDRGERGWEIADWQERVKRLGESEH
jgi:radical SAM protein with 4Fe4S-binding SPASM domain